MTQSEQDSTVQNLHAADKTVAAVAWGLSFMWMGASFLANLGWGLGFLGLGVITLGAQLVRKYLGLAVDAFWLTIGVAFVVWSFFA
jgi:hypothetical protein